MIPLATSENLPTLRYWKKQFHSGLIIAGFITMMIALWSIFEPGLHKGREFIHDFTIHSQRAALKAWLKEGVAMKNGTVEELVNK